MLNVTRCARLTVDNDVSLLAPRAGRARTVCAVIVASAAAVVALVGGRCNSHPSQATIARASSAPFDRLFCSVQVKSLPGVPNSSMDCELHSFGEPFLSAEHARWYCHPAHTRPLHRQMRTTWRTSERVARRVPLLELAVQAVGVGCVVHLHFARQPAGNVLPVSVPSCPHVSTHVVAALLGFVLPVSLS